MKVVTVCGMGFGTSLMLLMSVKESGRKYGITVEGDATDLGSYKGKSCDLLWHRQRLQNRSKQMFRCWQLQIS